MYLTCLYIQRTIGSQNESIRFRAYRSAIQLHTSVAKDNPFYNCTMHETKIRKIRYYIYTDSPRTCCTIGLASSSSLTDHDKEEARRKNWSLYFRTSTTFELLLSRTRSTTFCNRCTHIKGFPVSFCLA